MAERYRSAVTGRFVTKAQAKRRPKTTIRERARARLRAVIVINPRPRSKRR